MAGRRLLVAVSGGPDSLALLYALHSLRQELDLTLHGAHLDHRIRGDASRQDADFVARIFTGLSIDSTFESADVKEFQRANRLSPEEAAREVRHSFLAKVATKQGAAAIALGHTSNDQAESVLMHLLRGTGLTGLQGMRVVSWRNAGSQHSVLFRPLLNVSREETEAYCAAMDLEPRRDATNDALDLTRNRVRHQLFPVLGTYNPAIKQGLTRLARNASQLMDYVEQEVDLVWSRVCTASDGGLKIDLSAYKGLHPALQWHLLRRAIAQVKGDVTYLGQNHVEAMAKLAAGPAGKSLDLPGGVKFAVGYGEASIRRGDSALPAVRSFEGCHEVRIPGETRVPGWIVRVGPIDAKASVEPSGLLALLSPEELGDRAWVRSRMPGDRFQPLGMAQRKKLQDFMVDSKIPRGRRDGVPLLVTPRGIAWVVGWRIAEWAKAEGDNGLLVEFRPAD